MKTKKRTVSMTDKKINEMIEEIFEFVAFDPFDIGVKEDLVEIVKKYLSQS